MYIRLQSFLLFKEQTKSKSLGIRLDWTWITLGTMLVMFKPSLFKFAYSSSIGPGPGLGLPWHNWGCTWIDPTLDPICLVLHRKIVLYQFKIEHTQPLSGRVMHSMRKMQTFHFLLPWPTYDPSIPSRWGPKLGVHLRQVQTVHSRSSSSCICIKFEICLFIWDVIYCFNSLWKTTMIWGSSDFNAAWGGANWYWRTRKSRCFPCANVLECIMSSFSTVQ